MLGGSVVLTVLAIVLALVAGAILIAVDQPRCPGGGRLLLRRPSDTFVAIWQSVSGAYVAHLPGRRLQLHGGELRRSASSRFFDSLGFATPLIAAGLGIAVGFRSGMFNIGGQGQMLIGGAFAGYVGFAWPLPPGIHMIVALLAGLVGGAVWAGIVGVLKARTGAHEVIVTIMLNYVALYLIDYLLHTPCCAHPDRTNPQSPAEKPTAVCFPPARLAITRSTSASSS